MANKRQSQKIRELKQEIADLRKELEEVRSDRQRFRDHFSARFKWWLELLANGNTPNMEWLVKNDSQWLQNFKWWSW